LWAPCPKICPLNAGRRFERGNSVSTRRRSDMGISCEHARADMPSKLADRFFRYSRILG
jgi:hypothetical protein